MAEQYLACFPVVPCELCGKNAPPGVRLCSPCWELRQRVQGHATTLLRDPKTAPKVRELLEAALSAKPEPTPEAA